MSRQWNSDRAFVLFGDRVKQDDLVVAFAGQRRFDTATNQTWLIELCRSMKVEVMPPRRS